MKVEGFGPIAGDETQRHHVSGWTAKTVGELVDEIVSERINEWGSISVKHCGEWTNNRIEYKYGEVVSGSLMKKVRDLAIAKVTASGGWGSMDYFILPVYDSDGWKDGDVLLLSDGTPMLLAARDEDRAVTYMFDNDNLKEFQCLYFPGNLFNGRRIERKADEGEAQTFLEQLRAAGYTYMPQFRKVIRAKVLR